MLGLGELASSPPRSTTRVATLAPEALKSCAVGNPSSVHGAELELVRARLAKICPAAPSVPTRDSSTAEAAQTFTPVEVGVGAAVGVGVTDGVLVAVVDGWGEVCACSAGALPQAVRTRTAARTATLILVLTPPSNKSLLTRPGARRLWSDALAVRNLANSATTRVAIGGIDRAGAILDLEEPAERSVSDEPRTNSRTGCPRTPNLYLATCPMDTFGLAVGSRCSPDRTADPA